MSLTWDILKAKVKKRYLTGQCKLSRTEKASSCLFKKGLTVQHEVIRSLTMGINVKDISVIPECHCSLCPIPKT